MIRFDVVWVWGGWCGANVSRVPRSALVAL